MQTTRASLGLSQSELAEAMGLDRTMVAKIEAGTRRVDALELARLAAVLKVPMAHFLEEQPPVLSRRTVPLTEDTTTGAGRESNLLDLALESWMRELRQLIELGTLATRPAMTCPSPVSDGSTARAAARWLRGELGLGVEPIDSMLSLCERAGQFVLLTDLAGEGASAVDGDLGAAVVSLKGDPGRRRATAAHELGHLVLGDEYSSDLGVHASRASREATIDTFAAELLLPSSIFPDGDTLTREQLVGIAARYRTSWSLTLRQATAAGRGPIPKAWARSNPTKAEFLEALGWAPQSDLESVRVSPAVANAVMRAWRQGLITRRRCVELMHGQIQEGDLPEDPETDLEP
ncbi:helix-turn-helix domain-containing protein [Actinoplanes sp. TRM 88003]|uniref:Helix-turn-helix domain-containing protein n=1 Tax=Paractinoplanes aksuensis TaxID=2939490 RepID=A0ABT1DU92_9ACTN|nr:helix-turn-helix domain-containing protein [Actinoplanes aksuensis]